MIAHDTVIKREADESQLTQCVGVLANMDWSRSNRDWFGMIGMAEQGSDGNPVIDDQGRERAVIIGGKGDQRIRLPPEQCQIARKLRRAGWEVSEIASHLPASEDEVRLALATLRTKTPIATRRTLNVTLAAHEFVQSEAIEGEACWETVDRLLGELALRRAFATPTATNHI
jgi:hypothetical protein